MLKDRFSEKFSFNDKYIAGDFDFFINISLCEKKIGCIQEPLAYYRIHNDNYSSTHAELHIKELNNWLKKQQFLKTDYNFSLLKQKFYVFKLQVNIFLNKKIYISIEELSF